MNWKPQLAGRGRIVLVEGAPGIGKSRLLGELAGDAAWRGFTVLWGACDEASAIRPLPRDPARPGTRTAPGPGWHNYGMPTARAARCRQPCPAPAGGLGITGSIPARARADRQAGEALSRVLIGLTEHAPVMLVLEDLHWADDETLGLLQLLGRQTPAGRLVVVLSFRDLQAREDERTWAVLRTLDRDARPRRIQLAGLTRSRSSSSPPRSSSSPTYPRRSRPVCTARAEATRCSPWSCCGHFATAVRCAETVWSYWTIWRSPSRPTCVP